MQALSEPMDRVRAAGPAPRRPRPWPRCWRPARAGPPRAARGPAGVSCTWRVLRRKSGAPELPLQGLDRGGQAGLRDVQTLGRAGEMALLGDRHEVFELAQLHVVLHSSPAVLNDIEELLLDSLITAGRLEHERTGPGGLPCRRAASATGAVSAIGLGGMPMSIEGRPDEPEHRRHPRRAGRGRDAHRHRGRLPPVRRRGSATTRSSSPGAGRQGGDRDGVLVATKGGHPARRRTAGRGRASRAPEGGVQGVAQAARGRGHRPLPVPPSRPEGPLRGLGRRAPRPARRGQDPDGGHLQREPDADPPGERGPGRPAGGRAEPVLAGVPLLSEPSWSCARSWASPSCRGARSAASRGGDLGSRSTSSQVARTQGVSRSR